MKDPMRTAMDELERANRDAIEKDRETAKTILAGGVDGLKKFCETIKADIEGFERQVWEGRKDRNDLTLDDLIAMRAYAVRVIARAEFYINLAEQNGTTPKPGEPES
jgi:hypothetical protein